ncbi:MAG TPA: hypothetical protein VGJ20_00020 [Xanthobacteraceae bacterium]
MTKDVFPPALEDHSTSQTEPRSPRIRWDVYPALPRAIKLGEVAAADEREAIEKAAKKFRQDPAILIVMRRR